MTPEPLSTPDVELRAIESILALIDRVGHARAVRIAYLLLKANADLEPSRPLRDAERVEWMSRAARRSEA